MIDVIYLFGGLIAVLIGADIVITNCLRIARTFKISEVFIGLTIISIGTSLPEIFTHIASSIKVLNGAEASGIAIGTNIGSNIIQITLILGLVSLFAKVHASDRFLKVDYSVMLGAIALLFLLSLDGRISRIEGVIMALLYIVYLIFMSEKEHVIQKIEHKHKPVLLSSFLVISGFVILSFASDLVVDKALLLSHMWGINESFIGTLIIGVSTALPEFTTAIIAIFRGSTRMSVGTLIGSNITNPLFALGIGAAISGYTADSIITWFDLPFWFFISVIALIFFITKKSINKREAIMLMFSYAIYVFIKIRYFMY